ncbi:hypothetical protein C8R46DRAFT_1220515 [Mycena filopes]|nr:hypothetical protein C8R46DRAFT_1220515 [Mycena filopes]
MVQDALKDTARAYTDEEFAALLQSLSLEPLSSPSTSPLTPPTATATTPPTATGATAAAPTPRRDPSPSTSRAARTPPPSPSRAVYLYETPTKRGLTTSWALAGSATQGIPGAHVRAVVKSPKKKRNAPAAGYAVFVGRVPGVFETWAQARLLVDGVKGSIFRGYRTLDDASAAYAYALEKGWTRVCGLAMSTTTTPTSLTNPLPTPLPLATRPPAPAGTNPLHGSESLDDTWYVVYRGILPGVYRSILEASLNTVGVSGALFEGFSLTNHPMPPGRKPLAPAVKAERRKDSLRRYAEKNRDALRVAARVRMQRLRSAAAAAAPEIQSSTRKAAAKSAARYREKNRTAIRTADSIRRARKSLETAGLETFEEKTNRPFMAKTQRLREDSSRNRATTGYAPTAHAGQTPCPSAPVIFPRGPARPRLSFPPPPPPPLAPVVLPPRCTDPLAAGASRCAHPVSSRIGLRVRGTGRREIAAAAATGEEAALVGYAEVSVREGGVSAVCMHLLIYINI